MHRFLLIAYFYSPSMRSGAVRARGLAKYLPEFGWEPIVLTPRWSTGRGCTNVAETDDRDVLADLKAKFRFIKHHVRQREAVNPQVAAPSAARFSGRWIESAKRLLTYPDPIAKGWFPFAAEALPEVLKRNDVRAVLSTSPPITGHLLGRRAKDISGLPWIADLRDLWIGPETSQRGLDRLQRRLERKTLRRADALVTVSRQWAEFLQNRHHDRRVFSILNGFDPDEALPVRQLTTLFTLTHTGYLYEGKRDPSPLFEALQELTSEGVIDRNEIRVRFYGFADRWLYALVERYRIHDMVEIHGEVPRQGALQSQRESQMLLLLGMNIESDSGCYPAKIFEYLAASRPVLALGGRKGAIASLLNETGAGHQVFTKPELRQALIEAYNDFRGKGSVSYKGQSTAVDTYTQRAMARQFAAILDSVTERGPADITPLPEDNVPVATDL